MKTATRILENARALISEPEHWTRGTMARVGVRGRHVDSKDADATCFCALGALRRAASSGSEFEEVRYLLGRAIGSLGAGKRIALYNDRKGCKTKRHAEILAAFDAAIKLSKPRKRVSA